MSDEGATGSPRRLAADRGWTPVAAFLLLLPACGAPRAPGADAAAGSIHPPGWAQPDAALFHAGYIAGAAWILDECRDCHGADDRGDGDVPGCNVQGCHEVTEPSDCGFCHGDADEPGPPPGLRGTEEATDPGVGAHARHASGGDFGPSVDCVTCHVVPQDDSAAGDHPSGDGRAHVAFAGLALPPQKAVPVYDPDTGSCSATYCHGPGTPRWIEEGPLVCGDCHESPPAMHGGTRCVECHDGVADATTILLPARHMDGIVDTVDLDRCDTCHGTGEFGAPPPALGGATGRDVPGAAVHAEHLGGRRFTDGVGCAECHVVPEEVEDVGHVDDDAPAEVVFGVLATTGGVVPAYDGMRCTNVYCHGTTLAGGTNPAPRWAGAPLDEIGCGSCHSLPPPNHIPVPDGNCAVCHSTVIDVFGVLVGLDRHVNGVVDFNL